MIHRPVRSFSSSSRAVLAAASVALSAACWTIPGDALVQASTAAAASAAAGTSAPALTGQTYAVKPGQSLNDVAGDLTGSKDRDVREKMARALFEANPNAFGNRDINKLRLGSVLNVPVTDVTPAPETTLAPSVTPAPTPAPAASAPAANAPAKARTGPDPMLFGVGIAVLIGLFLLFRRRGAKRRREEVEAEARAAAATSRKVRDDAQPPAAADTPRHDGTAAAGAAAATAAVADDLEGRAVERDQSELNAVAASLENYDAAEAQTLAEPPTPVEPEPAQTPAPKDIEASSAPFVPAPSATHHPAFMPPLHGAASGDAKSHDAQSRDIASHEAADREARKWEEQERQTAARQAASEEAEERENRAREFAAREALAKDLHARELQLREAEAKRAAEQEHQAEQARKAAEREIAALGAELRAAQELAEQERALRDQDDESAAPMRFPMPKFPQDAIQALDSLDLGLPPRMELTLNLPNGPVTSTNEQPKTSPVPAPAPFVPSASADTRARPADSDFVTTQIEAGTAGAASVAGLGATQFPPLSLDFAANLPKTEPLPSLTSQQLAAIARNKLELAGEYIELGDLPGARTLLQEVIASNDPATRQQATTLLSTFASHS